MKRFLLATAIAFAAVPALAQTGAPAAPAAHAAAPAPAPLADADPALWVVRDADTIIYLFGTFHMLDARPWFNDEVRAAFDASDELVLEAIIPEDPAALQPLIMRYALDRNGHRLSQQLTPEENAALNAAIAPLGAPPGAFDPLEPWFVSLTLAAAATQRLGVDTANGPETVLSRSARERRIPIAELESMEWQLQLFDNMPEAQQLAQLRQTLRELDQLPGKLAPMLAAWSRGDVEGLQRIVDAYGDEDPELHRLLFTSRNATWAAWIQQRLARPGTVFVAVGAGHLAGRDSVLAVLNARGLRPARLPHRPAH